MEKATFAGGCFWQTEAEFRMIEGVTGTTVGYTGGHVDNPSYRDVCGGRTGHAESIEIEFDPAKVTYEHLLDAFFATHDPTTLNRQGPDVGHQYRSAVFYHSPEQKAAVEAHVARVQTVLDQRPLFKKKVVTEIVPAVTFWPAEDYHQRYLEKRGMASCRIPGQEVSAGR